MFHARYGLSSQPTIKPFRTARFGLSVTSDCETPDIVDFYAPAAKLVIEIDGGQHFFDEHLRKDQKRDAYLSSLNLKILRFNNWQILKSLGDVLKEIHRQIENGDT